MKNVFTAFALLIALATQANAAPRQCNPEKSKPCGKSCISKSFTCHVTIKSVDDAIVKAKK